MILKLFNTLACGCNLTRQNTLFLAILNDFKDLLSSLGSTSSLITLEAKVQKHRLLSHKHINFATQKMTALKSKKQKEVGLLVDEVISKVAYDEYVDDLNKQIDKLTINVQKLETYLQTKADETSPYELTNHLEASVKELTPDLLNGFSKKLK